MHDDDEYIGTATITAGERSVTAKVHLRGYFEPLDGRFRWYGRVASDPAVAELAGEDSGNVLVWTDTNGERANATLGDPDPWNRLRISGIGRPPFPVSLTSPSAETSTAA